MGGSPGVVFDVDGTLLDTNYLHVVAWSRALRAAGHSDVAMAEVHRAIGIASDELLQRLIGRSDDDIAEAHSLEYGKLRDQVRAFPAVADLLHRCRDAGLVVVLATSGGSDDLDWMLPAVGAEDAIAGAVTSDDVDVSKPEPDLLRTGLEKFGLDPQRTVAVGDTIWDVQAANRAHLSGIGMEAGGIDRTVLTAAGAAQVYAAPADLLTCFDRSPLSDITE